ncbi:thioredoxin domain-containing protein [Melioribacteraceae bacterium 4301-Me]|uniref:thioredoxin domain-containing protein n=1 Tax=Pyranulibacter aquaticus TaxID=3163344 RepID=UPI0035991BEB
MTINRRKPNKLINEKSPYLLQHAYNPVNWFPWSSEAFEIAEKENKPIFLSIGYSTCHWCHVMEKESFEDEEIADILNKNFISVKVDREERPDIDNIYMTVCQMITGSGGWPLSIFMTSDKKPFFAGTYFPKEDKYGRIGFKNLLVNIIKAWQEKKEEIELSANEITSYLKQSFEQNTFGLLDEKVFHQAFQYFEKKFDNEYGGFGSAPKFPSPHNLMFLLRYYYKYKNEAALVMVEKTLTQMRLGGIFDQIGYGFHRYSTDRKWLIPHFEKMLYDQALLIHAYAEIFQLTKNNFYKKVVDEIVDYVARDMSSIDGGFFSAEDADSEGVEGKFYLWTKNEIIETLGKEQGEFFSRLLNVELDGNFCDEISKQNNGKNILHLKNVDEFLANEIPINELRKKLFEQRNQRIKPHKDDKILTDWNGLMISALAKASRVFNRNEYMSYALKSADFVIDNLMDNNGNLYHRYRQGEKSIAGNLDDYAFFIWGLLEIFASSFEPSYVKTAIKLIDLTIEKFWDSENGGFFFTELNNDILVRTKEIYDGAIPSGNAVMMQNLIKVSRIAGENKYEEIAQKALNSFAALINNSPHAFTQSLIALKLLISTSYEIVIVNESGNNESYKKLFETFLPNIIIIELNRTNKQELANSFEFFKNFKSTNDKPTFYLCENYQCQQPTNDIEIIYHKLGIKNSS